MYSERFGPAIEFNQRVLAISSKAKVHDLLEKSLRRRKPFLDEPGQLKPQYRPDPLIGGFMHPPVVAEREQIPAPPEPVEGL